MRSTEKDSLYQNLEQMSVLELLNGINQEDQKVAIAVNQEIKAIEKLVVAAVKKMQDGGRIFYIGAGTSGRLGILDASELPPTFGADPNWVVGMIAGGDKAIRKAVEFAEDDEEQAFIDLKEYHISSKDFVIGIAASGTTPYVIGGLKICRSQEISTACITCNSNAPVLEFSDFPICVEVGPEFVTGSTRMKAGTAQKLVLNMISTSIMIRLGRVKGNKMVDMQLSNNKLVDRGVRMLMSETGLDYDAAHKLLKKHENVRSAINSLKS
tara:strand:+ start:3923 stop:4726 length:804 start_codon:yes stop_codon:yes gene_type:complete